MKFTQPIPDMPESKLGNASVYYVDSPYVCDDGTKLVETELEISDQSRYVTLTFSEALALLKWLQEQEATLRKPEESEEK